MKIFFTGNSEEERSRPNDNYLVFGGYTHCFGIDGVASFYLMDRYSPIRGFSHWEKYKEVDVSILDIQEGLDPKAAKGVVYRDITGEPVEFFGVTEFYTSGGTVFHDIYLVSEDTNDGEDILNAYSNLKLEPIRSLSGYSFSKHIFVDDDAILGTWYGGQEPFIYRINKDLEILWERQLSGKDIGAKVVLDHKDSVIACAGKRIFEDTTSRVFALDKATGEMLWETEIPVYIRNMQLIGDRVYISSNADRSYLVVCANTGEILFSKHEKGDDSAEFIWLWSDSGYMFGYYTGAVIRVFDESTGSHVQDIEIPNGFSLAKRSPQVKGDYIYFLLSSGGGLHKVDCYGGVMVLPREELRQGFPLNIEVEDKGDISYQAIKDGKTEYYEITASYEELGDVLRFGQIEVRLVAQKYAYNFWGNMEDNFKARLNKKFNGRIVLCVDKARLKNPDESKFDLMVKLFNEHFKEKSLAPAIEKPLTLEWKYI